MTPAYVSAFGLSGAPFSKEIADAELWLPPSTQQLVDALEEACASAPPSSSPGTRVSARRACCGRCGTGCRKRASG